MGCAMLSPTRDSAAKWNTASHGPSASTASSAAASARSATTRRTPSGTAARWPWRRLSSTTTSAPCSAQQRDEVAADIAGAAGDEES